MFVIATANKCVLVSGFVCLFLFLFCFVLFLFCFSLSFLGSLILVKLADICCYLVVLIIVRLV